MAIESSDAAGAVRTITANIASIEGEARWWVPIVAQTNPAERVDLQPPEAPKAPPSERRNDEADAEAADIAQLQQEAAAARRRAADTHETSGTVGSPVRRGPQSRRRSDNFSPPGSRALPSAGEKDRTRRIRIVVDPEDPVVEVKIRDALISEEGVTIRRRVSSSSSSLQKEQKRADEDSDELVTISQERLAKVANVRRRSSDSTRLASRLSLRDASSDRSFSTETERGASTLSLSRGIAMKPPSSVAVAPARVVGEESEKATASLIQSEDLALKRAEEYLSLQRSTVRTSDNTLASTKLLSRQQRAEIMEQLPKTHATQCTQLIEKYRKRFRGWLAELYAGFNLIFYGVGSKKALLDAFAQETLRNGGPVSVIAGHHPSTSIKTVLGTISRDVLSIAHCPSEPAAQLAAIARELAKNSALHIFVLLHGIDGRGLRGRPTQALLSELAALEKIHMVASFEHRLTPYAWDTVLIRQFNWLWNHVPTFATYEAEVQFEHGIGGGAAELIKDGTGVLVVLSSVPRTTRTIFQLLADYHIKNPAEKHGILSQRFASLCKDELLCDDTTYKSAARELFEHHIIVRHKGPTGEEYVRLRMTPTTIAQVVAYLKNVEEADDDSQSEDDEPP